MSVLQMWTISYGLDSHQSPDLDLTEHQFQILDQHSEAWLGSKWTSSFDVLSENV